MRFQHFSYIQKTRVGRSEYKYNFFKVASRIYRLQYHFNRNPSTRFVTKRKKGLTPHHSRSKAFFSNFLYFFFFLISRPSSQNFTDSLLSTYNNNNNNTLSLSPRCSRSRIFFFFPACSLVFFLWPKFSFVVLNPKKKKFGSNFNWTMEVFTEAL